MSTERDLTANGVRLRVTEQGRGPYVLMLHDALRDRTSFSALARELMEDFTLVMPDLPGAGESEKPAPQRHDYRVAALAQTMADLCAGLRLGRLAVVGHGLGGAVAITLAARHPELCTRLALINAHCFPLELSLTRRLALTPVLGRLLVRQLWGQTAFRALVSPGGPAVEPERLAHYYQHFNSPAARSSALALLESSVDTRGVIADTHRLQLPALVVWGRHDSLNPASHGLRLSREIRGAGFQLFDAGAAPHEQRPQELGAALRAFLSARRLSLY